MKPRSNMGRAPLTNRLKGGFDNRPRKGFVGKGLTSAAV